jgi:hypothetical protein
MRPQTFFGQGFAGGLNTREAAYQIEQNQARDLLNVLGTSHGAVRKREGSVTLATTAAPFLSLLPVEVTATRYLIGQGGTAFHKIDEAGAVTTITGATVPTTGERWAHIQAQPITGQGPVYMCNGVDTPQQWTGSGNLADWTAAAGTLPNGRYMKTINNRTWVAGMTSYTTVSDPGSALVFSEIGDPRTWPAQNIVLFDPNDGDKITGLGTVGPYLLVFKRRKVFVVYDLDTGANRRISDNTGCCAPRSIVETPGGTYFLSLDRGVFTTNGSTVTLVSDVIRDTVASILPARREFSAGAFHENHYYLSVSRTNAFGPDTTLDFDTTLNSWWMHSFAANQFAVWSPTREQGLYAAPPALRVDRCLQPAVFADNGAGYQAYWTGAWMSPSYFRRRIIQTPEYRKRLRGIRFDGSGALNLSVGRDFSGSPTFVKAFDFRGTPTTFGGGDTYGGAGFYGDAPTTQQGRAFSMGTARAFSLQWGSDAMSTAGWQVETFTLLMADRSD